MSVNTINKTTTPLSPILIDLFKKRDFTHADIQEFFSWDLQKLPNFSTLIDIEKASLHIIEAMKNGKRIGIYGDYDTDGTTSCALFYHFFKMLDVEVDLFQPSRFDEGYGIHISSIDKALEKGVQLLVSVDCGITNVETAKYTLDKEIDLIITDHHSDVAAEMPPAIAIVNPNRRDEPKDSPMRALAGVGVAFAVCVEIRKQLLAQNKQCPTLYPLLQFVAIGTICDMAKLNFMNIKLVRHGLKQIPTTNYPGIEAFFSPEERKVEMLASEKISFGIGPLINSKGRLEHPLQALNLLISDNPESAFENYSHLEISNRERKFIQAEVFKEAKQNVLNKISSDEMLINIPYNPKWHEGVVGIVANKLVDTFEVPAVVFTDSEDAGIVKASARSTGTLNLFDCLNQCSDLFKKFGGHAAAAGLSMTKKNLPAFRERMNNILREIPHIERTKQDHFDLNIDFNLINHKLVKDLELLEPFGEGNSRPVFRMSDFRIESFTILKDLHVKWFLSNKNDPKRKLQGISFFMIGKWNQLSPDELFARQESEALTAQFQVGINRFNGNEYIQLIIDKIFP